MGAGVQRWRQWGRVSQEQKRKMESERRRKIEEEEMWEWEGKFWDKEGYYLFLVLNFGFERKM